MGGGRAENIRAARDAGPAGSPAAMTEPEPAHPRFGSGRLVSPTASAALLGRLAPGCRKAAALVDLQRYRGNRYVGDVLQAMRDGRFTGSPGDRWEREADRVADQVVSPAARPAAAAPPTPVTRGREVIQRSAGGPRRGAGAMAGVPGAGATAGRAIAAARGGGRPLPGAMRVPLERSMGEDFGAVRIHTDAAADRLARGMGAVAFTTGPDIFFRRGRYDPGTQPGRHLLAHELTHVVQQHGLTAPPIQRKMGLEYELDDIHTRHTSSGRMSLSKTWVPHDAGEFIMARPDYDITADIATGMVVPRSHVEFRTRAFDETVPAEVGRLIAAANSILADIHAIKVATHRHLQPGYGAGNPWVLGGQRGWFAAADEWIGLNAIPRLRGPWHQQVTYAGQFSKDAVGTLQLTAGFSLLALQRLVTGQQLGSIPAWPARAQNEPRQYLHGYARQAQQSPQLYRTARAAVDTYQLSRGGAAGSGGMMAAILTVMAQLPLSQRSAKYDIGNMIAKTDYAKILSMARAEGMQFTQSDLLRALLFVVNAHLTGDRVRGHSPVFPDTGPPDLTKVSFQQWVEALVPPRRAKKGPEDLMTRASYPGTQAEKGALRAFGPYRHADPGAQPGDAERAIFELRSIMSNPSADLPALVSALVDLMHALHR